MKSNSLKTSCIALVMFLVYACVPLLGSAQEASSVYPGADEKSPSRAQYFSWINNTNEGATEAQTMINLEFFNWLHETYGMTLDIYAFDAGAIDGKRFYGSMHSERFKSQFPKGFQPMYEKAKAMNTRLGIWGGPDGFGDTEEETALRTEQMVSLCRDFEFALFKFDAVCGALREEKEDDFVNMMIQCRLYSPDLILLNHRLGLKKGKPYATTFLWGGQETYIDVFASNHQTAPHHRAGAISRGLVPGLQRLTEDHGTCISSCLDYWDDDLILQAFNRSLILAPEIYGNPWLLRDDEFPKLARIYNLHKKYREILVDGTILPENFGPYAVARGDSNTCLLSLRNLSWQDTVYTFYIDSIPLLKPEGVYEIRQYHPTEKLMGNVKIGTPIMVRIPSFRSCLLLLSSEPNEEVALDGIEYAVVKDIPEQNIQIDLLGMPGQQASFTINQAEAYKRASINGKEIDQFSGEVNISFPGKTYKSPYHQKLIKLTVVDKPMDTDALYEATVFAADNNALEVRSIQRSGWSEIPQVLEAQQAFFEQDVFVDRGIWDKNLFDGDRGTGFWPSIKYNVDQRVKGGCFRLDLGAVISLDTVFLQIPDYFSLQPLLIDEAYYAEVSTDLNEWERLKFMADTLIAIPLNEPLRYLKISYYPRQITEVYGRSKGETVDRSAWRASNLFASSTRMKAQKLWSASVQLDEIHKGSYLCIAINGVHGVEGAYAAVKVDGQLMGCPDRAVSYPSNTWEYVNARSDKNYTYYFPVDQQMEGKQIEVFVMAYEADKLELKPELWITANPIPFEKMRLELKPN